MAHHEPRPIFIGAHNERLKALSYRKTDQQADQADDRPVNKRLRKRSVVRIREVMHILLKAKPTAIKRWFPGKKLDLDGPDTGTTKKPARSSTIGPSISASLEVRWLSRARFSLAPSELRKDHLGY